MQLLFLISGMGVRYSLRSRDAGAFARERLRRLGVPLLAGLLTLVPLQVHLGLRRAGDQASLGEFYASFWDLRPAPDLPLPVAADPRVGEAFQRHWRPAAALDARVDPFTGMDPLSLAFRLLKASTAGCGWWPSWGSPATASAVAPRARPRPRPWPQAGPGAWPPHASDAVLPFYVPHETVIVVVADAVLSWPIAAASSTA